MQSKHIKTHVLENINKTKDKLSDKIKIMNLQMNEISTYSKDSEFTNDLEDISNQVCRFKKKLTMVH
jgi:hypothetical protein